MNICFFFVKDKMHMQKLKHSVEQNPLKLNQFST